LQILLVTATAITSTGRQRPVAADFACDGYSDNQHWQAATSSEGRQRPVAADFACDGYCDNQHWQAATSSYCRRNR